MQDPSGREMHCSVANLIPMRAWTWPACLLAVEKCNIRDMVFGVIRKGMIQTSLRTSLLLLYHMQNAQGNGCRVGILRFGHLMIKYRSSPELVGCHVCIYLFCLLFPVARFARRGSVQTQTIQPLLVDLGACMRPQRSGRHEKAAG